MIARVSREPFFLPRRLLHPLASCSFRAQGEEEAACAPPLREKEREKSDERESGERARK